jgi:signal transduction histidine kinase
VHLVLGARQEGGAGLGLAIARNIARWHGGDIHLRNAPEGKRTDRRAGPATVPLKRGSLTRQPERLVRHLQARNGAESHETCIHRVQL